MKDFIKKHVAVGTRVAVLHRIKSWKAWFYSSDLNQLARIHGSDKWGGHWYTQHFAFHFGSIRYKKLKIFEIGVGGYDTPYLGGNSLRMWKSYFPYSEITSLDIVDKSPLNERRIRIYKGSQADNDLLRRIHLEAGPFDIIIDDGSHINEHVISSFEALFPLLKDGGIYVVEDTQTAYIKSFGGDPDDLSNPSTMVNYFRQFVHKVNYMEYKKAEYSPDYYEQHIHSIHFYHNLIVLHKKFHGEKSNLR